MILHITWSARERRTKWHESSARRTVAATSLSDIVCGFHVAGYCIKTTSDPTITLIWRKLKVGPKLRALRRQKPQSPSCRRIWRLAFLVLTMLCGIRGPHDGDCTYWRGALQPSRSEFLDRSRIRLPRDPTSF